MANISVTNTFVNGQSADATEVNTNFTDIINGTSDGTKDISINALTVAGAGTFNGAVTLGNGTGDDITITGSLAATLNIKTDGSFDIGSSTLGLQVVYFGDGGGNTVGIQAPAIASNYTMTLPAHTTVLPASDGAASDVLVSDGSGTWSFSGGPAQVAKTTTYTATTADKIISVTTGSAWTLTLYSAASQSGRTITIIKTSTDFNALTIDPDGSETINGNSTTTINTAWESLTLMSNGTNWVILNRKCNSATESWTPTGTWSNNITWTGMKTRVGDHYHYQVKGVAVGAMDTATLRITLSDGLTIDTAKFLSTTAAQGNFGAVEILDSGVQVYEGFVSYSSTSAVEIKYSIVGSSKVSPAAVTQAAPMTWASGDTIQIRFAVPISTWKGEND